MVPHGRRAVKYGSLLCAALITFANPSSAQASDIGAVQESADRAFEAISESQIFHSTLGLAWSDAFLGTLYPFPSHFGIGLMGGLTQWDSYALSGLLAELGLEGTMLETLTLPAAAAEFRFGGLFLPFDVGFKVDLFPDTLSFAAGNEDFAFTIGSSMIGADIRYALVAGRRLFPDLSLGFGLNRIGADLGFRLKEGQEIDIPSYGVLSVEKASVGVSWETTSIDLRVHASKRFFILTPYAGFGATYGWTKARYSVSGQFYKGELLIDYDDLEEIKAALDLENLQNVEFELDGFSSAFKHSGWDFRTYVGIAVAFGSLFLDLSQAYNVSDGSLGTVIGVRLQR